MAIPDIRAHARALLDEFVRPGSKTGEITLAFRPSDLKWLNERKEGDTANYRHVRRLLFAGALDQYLTIDGAPITQTFVRYFDAKTQTTREERLFRFLGSTEESVDDDIQVERLSPDPLTEQFLDTCFGTRRGLPGPYALPGSDTPDSAGKQRIDVVRLLSELRMPPKIKIEDFDPQKHFFPVDTAPTIRLCTSDAEEAALNEKRIQMIKAAKGTGINEFSAIVWLDMSRESAANATAQELLEAVANVTDNESGPITFEAFRCDEMAVRELAEKAEAHNIIGPLRLSANVLVLDVENGCAVLQTKRQKGRPRAVSGGGYMAGPSKSEMSNSYVISDDHDLVRTARREVLEELNIALPIGERRPYVDLPAVLLLQLNPAYLQVCFLGWEAAPQDLNECFKHHVAGTSNDEGLAIRLPVSQLGSFAINHGSTSSVASELHLVHRKNPWRPAGLLALFAWHAMKCPGLKERDRDPFNDEMTCLRRGIPIRRLPKQ